MKKILCFLGLVLVTSPLFAQTDDEKGIRACIDQLFTAMRQGDSGLLARCFAPTAVLQTIATGKDGQVTVKSEPVQAFLNSVGTKHNEVYDEQIKYGSIHVDGPLAAVWTPYRFYLGKTFSHCGVNSFQLVKIAGTWKVQYIIDTRRKEGCL